MEHRGLQSLQARWGIVIVLVAGDRQYHYLNDFRMTSILDNAKYKELTHAITGCAMRVQPTLGNGFQEVIYQRCLAIELAEGGIGYKWEKEIPIFYKSIDVG